MKKENKHTLYVFKSKQGIHFIYVRKENKSIKLQSCCEKLNCHVPCFLTGIHEFESYERKQCKTPK